MVCMAWRSCWIVDLVVSINGGTHGYPWVPRDYPSHTIYFGDPPFLEMSGANRPGCVNLRVAGMPKGCLGCLGFMDVHGQKTSWNKEKPGENHQKSMDVHDIQCIITGSHDSIDHFRIICPSWRIRIIIDPERIRLGSDWVLGWQCSTKVLASKMTEDGLTENHHEVVWLFLNRSLGKLPQIPPNPICNVYIYIIFRMFQI